MVGFVTTGTLMLALRPLAVACGFTVGPGGRKSHIGEVPVHGRLPCLLLDGVRVEQTHGLRIEEMLVYLSHNV